MRTPKQLSTGRRVAFGRQTVTWMLMLGVSSSACSWGTRPRTFGPANGPEGATVAVRVAGEAQNRIGELYAADSSGVTIANPRLVHIPWKRLVALDVHRLDDYDIWRGEVVTAQKRSRIARVSRFPQGLTGDLLARVLRHVGQDSVEVVK
jgi:hypothetical protein